MGNLGMLLSVLAKGQALSSVPIKMMAHTANLRQLWLDFLDRFTFTAGDSDSIKSIFHAVCSWPFLSIMSYMYIPVCCWWLFLNNHRQCLSSHANHRLMLACVNSWITNSIFLSVRGQYLFKAQVADPPRHLFFRRLFPKINEDLEVQLTYF